MRAGEWEIGQVVIEIRRRPLRSIVAEYAICREPGGSVIRVSRGRVILLMASHAGGDGP